MKRDRLNRLAIDMRRRQVAELHLQGWSPRAIAERLEVATFTIARDLKAIRRQWQKLTLDDFDQMRAAQLAKLDRLEREAWEAWERSWKPARPALPDNPGSAGRKTVKSPVGDPRFLRIVQDCIAARRALGGLDAPKKLPPSDSEGRAITLTDLLSRIRCAAPRLLNAPAASNVFDLEAEFVRRAPGEE